MFLLSMANGFAIERSLLEKNITPQQLSVVLAKGTEWVKFPAYTDRAAWEALPQTVRAELIRYGEEALKCDWPTVKASECSTRRIFQVYSQNR